MSSRMKITVGLAAALMLMAVVNDAPGWLSGDSEISNNCVQTGTCGK